MSLGLKIIMRIKNVVDIIQWVESNLMMKNGCGLRICDSIILEKWIFPKAFFVCSFMWPLLEHYPNYY